MTNSTPPSASSLIEAGFPQTSKRHQSDSETTDNVPSSNKKGKLSTEVATIQPRPQDILFGRGRGFYEREGNQRLIEVTKRYYKEFQEARRGEKAKIVDKIIETVQNESGADEVRFLKPLGEEWQFATLKEMRAKTSHSLRDYGKRTSSLESSSSTQSPSPTTTPPPEMKPDVEAKRNDTGKHQKTMDASDEKIVRRKEEEWNDPLNPVAYEVVDNEAVVELYEILFDS